MATSTNSKMVQGHLAVAKAMNIPVSTKHCIELCRTLRYKNISYAKKYLEEVAQLKRAVEFKRFVRNTAHKRGMSSGRYPQKAAHEILKLLKSVEANAHFKGLNTGSLKITKLVANRAPNPFGGGRHRTGTKRSHVEVEVKEKGVADKKEKKTVDVSASKKEHTETVTKKVESVVPAHDHDHHDREVHTHTEGHNHTDHDHKHEEHKATSAAPVKPAIKAKVAAEEVSSAELLRRAQQKAAELKQRDKERKDAEQVSSLYDELQKKGSLRSTGVKK